MKTSFHYYLHGYFYMVIFTWSTVRHWNEKWFLFLVMHLIPHSTTVSKAEKLGDM